DDASTSLAKPGEKLLTVQSAYLPRLTAKESEASRRADGSPIPATPTVSTEALSDKSFYEDQGIEILDGLNQFLSPGGANEETLRSFLPEPVFRVYTYEHTTKDDEKMDILSVDLPSARRLLLRNNPSGAFIYQLMPGVSFKLIASSSKSVTLELTAQGSAFTDYSLSLKPSSFKVRPANEDVGEKLMITLSVGPKPANFNQDVQRMRELMPQAQIVTGNRGGDEFLIVESDTDTFQVIFKGTPSGDAVDADVGAGLQPARAELSGDGELANPTTTALVTENSAEKLKLLLSPIGQWLKGRDPFSIAANGDVLAPKILQAKTLADDLFEEVEYRMFDKPDVENVSQLSEGDLLRIEAADLSTDDDGGLINPDQWLKSWGLVFLDKTGRLMILDLNTGTASAPNINPVREHMKVDFEKTIAEEIALKKDKGLDGDAVEAFIGTLSDGAMKLQQLIGRLIAYEGDQQIVYSRDQIRQIVEAMSADLSRVLLSPRPANDRAKDVVTDRIFAAIEGARSEVRRERKTSRVARLSSPDGVQSLSVDVSSSDQRLATIQAELDFAVEQGWIKPYTVEKSHPVFATLRIPGVQLRIVPNPVRRPNDNMLVHLDTDDLFYRVTSGDGRRATSDSPTMSELAFHFNGAEIPVLARTLSDGTVEISMRETLWRSLENARLAGRKGALEMMGRVVGEGLKELRTSNSASALYSSIRYANDQFRSSGLSPSTDKPLMIVVTAEVVRKNFGFARTANILASAGHRLAILEDASLNTTEALDQFYRTYQLDNLRGSVLKGISADSAALNSDLAQFAGGRLDPAQVVFIHFEGEAISSAAQDFQQLELAQDVLGLSARKRADFPVPLLGARIALQPEAIDKLGDKYVVRQSDNHWRMNQTPDGGELSASLMGEIENFFAAAEAISSAA
ncbi:MAG: hypothetical protein KBC91_07600, partial [Candidatus Omnitrophica bacterium]|nr:hypothetical protein [Candidatus Omnitrophota bacterium]